MPKYQWPFGRFSHFSAFKVEEEPTEETLEKEEPIEQAQDENPEPEIVEQNARLENALDKSSPDSLEKQKPEKVKKFCLLSFFYCIKLVNLVGTASACSGISANHAPKAQYHQENKANEKTTTNKKASSNNDYNYHNTYNYNLNNDRNIYKWLGRLGGDGSL